MTNSRNKTVLLSTMRRSSQKPIFIRAGARLGLAGALLLSASSLFQHAIAKGDTRTLSFHHLHTGEDITITFKRNGRYDDAALKKLDWFVRDWRKQEAIHMDPQLFDLLWEAYQQSGATQPIQIVCGYRSPATNAMLRARSSGVAQFSQHMLGHAMDFFIPGVPLEKIREIGLRLQRGGVGFYPTSGSPFVHLDTGSVRYWPRMTYAQLSKVFPDGRTVHVAADGRTLPGYTQALAELGRRKTSNSLMAAHTGEVITARQEQEVEEVRHANTQSPDPNLLANLFDFMKPKNSNTDEAEHEKPTPLPATTSRRIAGSKPTLPEQPKRIAAERVTPLPASRPQIAAATPKQLRQPIVTALNNRIDRGSGSGAPTENSNRIAANAASVSFTIATAEPTATGSANQALSYATTVTPELIEPRRLIENSAPHLMQQISAERNDDETVAVKPPTATGGQTADSPWIRAAMLAPSVSHSMTATLTGQMDLRGLHPFLTKPSQSVTMTFSIDPASSLAANHFTGPAVVFLATTSFVQQKTASLQ
jgi:uncharacterized protein YcbK (DUF882 family)